jgi:hypothetical protein
MALNEAEVDNTSLEGEGVSSSNNSGAIQNGVPTAKRLMKP